MKKARALFEKAEAGRIKLETSELVVAEIVWVLESFYGFARKEITDVLTTLLSSRNLKIANHARTNDAVALYSSGNMDFIDAYNIAYMRSKAYTKVATFDSRHFKRRLRGLPLYGSGCADTTVDENRVFLPLPRHSLHVCYAP